MKQFGRLGLLEASRLENLVKLNHQLRPHEKMRSLGCREANILEDVTAGARDFDRHVITPSGVAVIAGLVSSWPIRYRGSRSCVFFSRTRVAHRPPPRTSLCRIRGVPTRSKFEVRRHRPR